MKLSQPTLFDRKSIRTALKAWHQPPTLAEHPLTSLEIVQREMAFYAGTPDEAGLALRRVLRQALDDIKPTDGDPDPGTPAWRQYLLLNEQYVKQRRAYAIRQELGLSESGYFKDQRKALDALGNQLREREAEAKPESVAADVAPTAVPPQPYPHNLPHQSTPFIGRQTELDQIDALLREDHGRLITLLGPGGIGKTRLSLASGQRNLDQFPDGVFFVPLASLRDPESLVPTIVEALRLKWTTQDSPEQQLLNYLSNKQLLLILDNFEHMLAATAVLSEILTRADNVRLLVSSRERLNLRSERVLELSGLNMADASAESDQSEAVQLFIDAARRANPDLTFTADQQPAIARICRLVQGSPLAIELAASWVGYMGLDDIVAEIELNLDFLATSLRDVPDRHQSLRGVFNHSWNLLSEHEKEVFKRLAIFPATFDRKAAQQVAQATLPLLRALHNKSLLRLVDHGRYAIHELLRQYAAEKLHASQTEFARVAGLHARYFLTTLQEQAAGLKGGRRQTEALHQVESRLENIVTAWQWTIAHDQSALNWQTAEAMRLVFVMLNRHPEGERLFARAAESRQWHSTHLAEDQKALTGFLVGAQAHFHQNLGRYATAQQLFCESLLLLRRLGSPAELATVSMLAIEANMSQPTFTPGELHAECSAILEKRQDKWGQATADFLLAKLLQRYNQVNHNQQAMALLDRSRVLRAELGDEWGEAHCLEFMGHVAYQMGDYEEARRRGQQVLDMHNKLGDRVGIGHSHNSLGQVAGSIGEYEIARRHYEESLKISREFGNQHEIAERLDCIGYVTYLLDNLTTAETHYQESLAISRAINDPSGVAWSLANLGDIANKHGRLDEARAHYLKSEALHAQTEPNGWGRIVSLGKLGQTWLNTGDLAQAEAYFTRAYQLALDTERKREATDVLYWLAEIWYRQGKLEDALAALLFLQNHPATSKDTRDRVDLLRVRLTRHVPETVARSVSLAQPTLTLAQFAPPQPQPYHHIG